MRREIPRWRALANATAVLVVLGVAVFGMVQVARRQWRWQETFRVRADFPTIGGLESGDRVRVQGIDAGVVERVDPPARPGRSVTLWLRLDARLRPLVRADARALIATEGVVGAKIIEIVPGAANAPPLADDGVIAAEPPIEVADLLRDARVSLHRLDNVAAAAETGLGEVNKIAASIAAGEGSIGRLVRDDEAYRRLVALSSRGERTLVNLEENLTALKRTWPLSRYFNDRGFEDKDRVLFQPGAERDSRLWRTDDLFEPGRSVLTADGRKSLDDAAAWFKRMLRPRSEVVIAAFTDDAHDPDLAQVLTQEQADSVRKYLVSKHKLDSINWFASRKVAAVGFGTQAPRTLAAMADGQARPPRRVEIFLFTPQT